MQRPDLLESRSNLIPHRGPEMDLPHSSENLYRIRQQEVDIGGQALAQEMPMWP